jgi:hypothetical protein
MSNQSKLVTIIFALCLLSACADGNHRPYTLDKSFGQTQKQIMQAQIADPEAAQNPPPDSPRKLDGYVGVNTMQTYRDSFGQSVQPQPEISINVGGATGGQQ